MLGQNCLKSRSVVTYIMKAVGVTFSYKTAGYIFILNLRPI